jgi:hypothetical protein
MHRLWQNLHLKNSFVLKLILCSCGRFATARISFPKTVIGKWISPRVASFSSRGPSTLSPTVLKVYIAQH